MVNIIKIPLQRKRKESTEIELVKASIKGDSISFTELIKLHKVSLYKIAYSYVKDEQKALEIIQDTTYKGLLNIKNLKNDDSYNNNEELENLARNKLGMIKQNEIIYLEK